MYLAWLHWDPSTDFITLPIIGLPVTWYGLLFATGFWIGFHIFIYMFRNFLSLMPEFKKNDIDWRALSKSGGMDLAHIKEGDTQACNELLIRGGVGGFKNLNKIEQRMVANCHEYKGAKEAKLLENRFKLEAKYPKIFTPLQSRARDFAEKLILYIIVATVLGARVGHILFYQNPMHYLANPLSILKTWEGGLASHGGIVAVLFSLWLFHRNNRKLYPDFTLFMLLDSIAIPTMLVASLIRIGNFFNQEILGVETTMPWGIIFGHPADGGAIVARHPAQLYESLFYFSVFLTLLLLWQKYSHKWEPGRFAGAAIFSSFFFRFFIEFIKTRQSIWFDQGGSLLLMGQVLSIPLTLIGAFLILRKRKFFKFG